MTAEQKKAHANKFRKTKEEPKNDLPKEVNKLPSQYTSSANSVMTDKENELYQYMASQDAQSVASANTQMSTHQQKFLSMVRPLNPMRVAGYNTCKTMCCCITATDASKTNEAVEVQTNFDDDIIPQENPGLQEPVVNSNLRPENSLDSRSFEATSRTIQDPLVSLQDDESTNVEKSIIPEATLGDDPQTAEVYVGGCDTSLNGNGFYIEATNNMTVDIQGFTDNIKVKSLPSVSAVTAVDVGDEVILLELHECIALEANQISLLSTFQAQEAGVVVNDVAKRHNGKQNIECEDYEIPLLVEVGLMN